MGKLGFLCPFFFVELLLGGVGEFSSVSLHFAGGIVPGRKPQRARAPSGRCGFKGWTNYGADFYYFFGSWKLAGLGIFLRAFQEFYF